MKKLDCQARIECDFRPMKYLLPLLMLLAANCTVLARLGESEAEIVLRYGKATAVLDSSIPAITRKEYHINGMKIIVCYLDGRSSGETISHEGAGSLNQLTANEIQDLLNANSLGSNWKITKQGSESENTTYELENGAATAENYINVFIDISSKKRFSKRNSG